MVTLKYLLLLLIIVAIYQKSWGQPKDTLINSTTFFKVGKFNSKGKRIGRWLTFNKLGYLEKEEHYKARKRSPNKAIKYEYSDNNKLESYGKLFDRRKHGKWKILNEKGKLVKIERFAYGDLHGTTKDIINKTKIKYYRGLTKNQLYNSKGKRYVFYFTYGLAKFRDWDCSEEKFACKHYPLAGCVVSYKIIRRTAIHNFFVSARQCLRFGLGWENKYFKGC